MIANAFQNYGSATTNGSQLGAGQFGLGKVVSQPAVTGTGGNSIASLGTTDTSTVLSGGQTAGAGQTGAGGNFWSKDGGAGLILGGVQVLGNLWNSYQSQKMAKKQMSFAREQWDTNLANQTQTYNTALEDRIRGRYAQGTRSEEQLSSEIDKHSL